MKSAILFSGGKDSTMALNYAIQKGDDVKYLISIKSKNNESYMFHIPNIDLTQLISEAVDIPLISQNTHGIKEEELKDLKTILQKLANEGIEAIYTGALFSQYQKTRIGLIIKVRYICQIFNSEQEDNKARRASRGCTLHVTRMILRNISKRYKRKYSTGRTARFSIWSPAHSPGMSRTTSCACAKCSCSSCRSLQNY